MMTLVACVAPENGGQTQDDYVPEDVSEQITDSLILAAEASERSGDWSGAVNYWSSLLNKDPANPRYTLGLGTALRRIGQYDESVRVLRDGLGHNPNDPSLVAAYGKSLLASGDQKNAMVELQRAASMVPGDWRIQSALGVAYGMAEQSVLAEQHYRQALALSPGNPTVLNNYALHRALDGDLATALELMEQAASSIDATTQVRQNLALLMAIDGDMLRAEQIVRSELTQEAADRQLAFLATLGPSDLDDLESYAGGGVATIESGRLPAPVEASSVVDLTNLETPAEETFLAEDRDTVEIEVVELEEIAPEPEVAVEPKVMEELDLNPVAVDEASVEGVVDAIKPDTAESDLIEAESAGEPGVSEDTASVSTTLAEQGGDGELLIVTAPALEPAADVENVAPVLEPEPPSPPDEDDVAAIEATTVRAMEPEVEPGESEFVATEPAQASTTDVVSVPLDEGYHVQLAALGSEAAAQAGAQSLANDLRDVSGVDDLTIHPGTTSDGSPTWRIFAGSFESRTDADGLCAAIKESGGDCYVRRE